MVKLISSRYEINSQSTAKNTAEMICQSWIPPIINRYAEWWLQGYIVLLCNELTNVT